MLPIRRLFATTVALLAIGAVPALADAPDPIPSATHGSMVLNGDGSRTLTVSGGTNATSDPGWRWTTHNSDCNTNRAGAGFAIVWNDPTDAGNPLTTFGVGLTGDNVVHPTPQEDGSKPASADVATPGGYANWLGGCGVYVDHGPTLLPDGSTKSGFWSQGTWGPISHTYPASVTGPVSVCPIMYDVHSGKGSGTPPNSAGDITGGGSGHNGDNSLEANGSTPQGNGCFAIDVDVLPEPANPVIAIDKTGPATGQAGDRIGYVLTVTNPGNEAFLESTLQVTDAQCNGDPVALIGKGGDLSPDSLDPGDVWTYSCSVQTAAGDTAVHNVAQVVASDPGGASAQASDDADTTLTQQIVSPATEQPGQLVLGARIGPGSARLLGPTGCAARAFNARVKGVKMASVVFVLDGNVVKRLHKVGTKTVALRVNPSKLRIGVHRLVVHITFQPGSGTKPKTMRLSFQRCGRKLVAPRFTG